jgi:predicted RND superfamily exporter protein
VLPAIIDAIKDDAALVIGLALLVMIIASWILIGGFEGPVVVISVVGFALLWLGAIMHLAGWKADMFNIIALPLLVGMGQDDAMHIYHRYKEGGVGRIRRAVRESGSAVFLTTLTTCVGFAGIFFSNHRGLLSLAKVAVVGMILCWVSSVFVLPAALRLWEWSRKTASKDRA